MAISIIEPREHLGRGLAYSAADADHRLNAPLEGHVIDLDRPGELWEWVEGAGVLHSDDEGRSGGGHVYLRRRDFGAFLTDLLLREASREFWAEQILSELELPHANLRQVVTRLDVYRHGHAMCRPLPGLIWGGERARFAADGARLRFAHADVSGFSLFEEAHYRGVLAAERSLRSLGVASASLLD